MSATVIQTARQVDEPIALDAGYRFDHADRRYIDEQIRGTQRHVVECLVGGVLASWYIVDPNSVALAKGDVFCAAQTGEGLLVTLATPAAIASAGRAIGIAMQAAPVGGPVQGALFGLLGRDITGLAESAAGAVRVSSAGRCEKVALIGQLDFPLGYVDPKGRLSLMPESLYVNGVFLGGLSWDGGTSFTGKATTQTVAGATQNIDIPTAGFGTHANIQFNAQIFSMKNGGGVKAQKSRQRKFERASGTLAELQLMQTIGTDYDGTAGSGVGIAISANSGNIRLAITGDGTNTLDHVVKYAIDYQA